MAEMVKTTRAGVTPGLYFPAPPCSAARGQRRLTRTAASAT